MKELIRKYTDRKYWLIPFSVIIICFITFVSAALPRDGDIYFIVANGEYILKHGFPKYNPFVFHEGLKIVIQQWIPSVAAYLGFKGPIWAFLILETMLGLYLLIYAIYKIVNATEPSRQRSLLMATIAVSSMLYLFAGKPMLYSIILLAFQLYVCESKKSWLWLPLIVLLEANIHASFIAFHFVYLLPYIVPGITKYLKNTADYGYIKALPLILAASLINPYGTAGALYLYNSYGTDLVSLKINELQPLAPDMIWFWILIAYLLFTAVQIYRLHIKRKKPIESTKFYLFAGSVLLIILFPQARNYIFTLLGSIPLISTFIPKFKGKAPPAKAMWGLAAATVIMTIVTIPSLPEKMPSMPVKSAEYMQQQENYVLYNGFNEGSYFEYKGVKSFIDARPELYMKKLNGKADVMEDYLTLALSDDSKKIDKLIEKYGFTHFCVRKDSILADYLQKQGKEPYLRDGDFLLFLN